MKTLPVRRRGIAIVALSFVFLTLGFNRSHHTAYFAVAACFFIAGLVLLRRGKQR